MIQFPSLGLRAYTQSMFTPIAPLKWVFRARHVFRLAWLERWPKLLSAPLYGLLRVVFQHWLHSVTMQDRRIWDTKGFDPNPRLVPGDGPIMAYRRWAAQFYPAATADQVSPLKSFVAPAESRQSDLAGAARSCVE